MATRLSFLNNNDRKVSDYSRQENLSLFLYRNHHGTFLSLYDGDCDIMDHEEYLSGYRIIDSLVYYVSDTRRMLCGYDFIDEDENHYE